MKSNSVVFPFTPFRNLQKKVKVQSGIENRTLDLSAIAAFLPKKPFASLPCNGKTTEEKILSIFLNPRVRFGKTATITQLKQYWIERIHYFTDRKKTLECTILGFPGKAPVPLKTKRRLPDFGELLALHRLHELTKTIKRVYKPGARITVITEGILGSYIGLSNRETRAYESTLARYAKQLQWDNTLRFIPLGNMTRLSGYAKSFRDALASNRTLYAKKDRTFMAKYKAALPSIFHLVSTRNSAYTIIQDAYKNNPKTKSGKKLHAILKKRAHEATLRYFAALSARDHVDFLGKKVPHHLALTVSPKPYRLGFQLVPNTIHLLAHHGVPINKTIIYRHGLLTSQKSYIRVFLKGDTDPEPFYYLYK